MADKKNVYTIVPHEDMVNICNAIREKTGFSGKILAKDMGPLIRSIVQGEGGMDFDGWIIFYHTEDGDPWEIHGVLDQNRDTAPLKSPEVPDEKVMVGWKDEQGNVQDYPFAVYRDMDLFPNLQNGIIDDGYYRYTYQKDIDGYQVSVKPDAPQLEYYGEIKKELEDYPGIYSKSLYRLFYQKDWVKYAPQIPDTVTDIRMIFDTDRKLTGYSQYNAQQDKWIPIDTNRDFSNYIIPVSVEQVAWAFSSCGPWKVPDLSLNTKITDMSGMYAYGTSGNPSHGWYNGIDATSIKLPPNVKNLNETFRNSTIVIQAPSKEQSVCYIPETCQTMSRTFYYTRFVQNREEPLYFYRDKELTTRAYEISHQRAYIKAENNGYGEVLGKVWRDEWIGYYESCKDDFLNWVFDQGRWSRMENYGELYLKDINGFSLTRFGIFSYGSLYNPWVKVQDSNAALWHDERWWTQGSAQRTTSTYGYYINLDKISQKFYIALPLGIQNIYQCFYGYSSGYSDYYSLNTPGFIKIQTSQENCDLISSSRSYYEDSIYSRGSSSDKINIAMDNDYQRDLASKIAGSSSNSHIVQDLLTPYHAEFYNSDGTIAIHKHWDIYSDKICSTPDDNQLWSLTPGGPPVTFPYEYGELTDNIRFYQVGSMYPYTINSSGVITKYLGDETEIEIPTIYHDIPVTAIGEYAFSGNNNIITVTVPDTITSIGQGAFKECENMVEINISPSVQDIQDEAFLDCENLQYVNIPEGIVELKMGIFKNCVNLEEISLPNSVTSISEYAFYGCSKLQQISTEGSIDTIGRYSFYNCQRLQSLEAFDSITSIGSYAFSLCSTIKRLNLPDTLITIGEGAFSKCRELDTIKISTSITSLEPYTFKDCSNILLMSIPDNITSIKAGVFQGCSQLQQISLSDTLTSLGDHAFSGCTSLESIEIPESLTSIGGYAFENCTSITDIEIPDNITSVGDYAFSGCKDITVTIGTTIGIDRGSNSMFAGISSGLWVYVRDTATTIGNRAFYSCSGLDGIQMATGITRIGEYAFYQCTNFKLLSLPITVESIGQYAFYGCTSLQSSISIPTSVSIIDGHAFQNCTSIQSAQLPEGLTVLGEYAFYKCSALQSINIPNGITSLRYTFTDCTSLESIVLPEGLLTLGDYAFSGCSSLSSINIPSTVTKLGTKMLGSCPKIQEITIPQGVSSIPGDSFYFDSQLNTVTFYNTVKSIGSYAFWGTALGSGTVYFYGTQDDWNSISISSYNTPLQNADKIFINI